MKGQRIFSIPLNSTHIGVKEGQYIEMKMARGIIHIIPLPEQVIHSEWKEDER